MPEPRADGSPDDAIQGIVSQELVSQELVSQEPVSQGLLNQGLVSQEKAAATLTALQAFFATRRALAGTCKKGALGREAAVTEAAGATTPQEPEEKVLALFREAARDVPAYRRFLAEHGIDPRQIDGIEAFRRLPATTKDNYYRKHALPD